MLGLLSVLVTLVSLSDQCQEIRMIAEDGTVIVGRSLEFSVVDSYLLSVPIGTVHIMPTLPVCDLPFQFENKYNSFNTRMRSPTNEWSKGDMGGMNEAGLSASGLYFPQFSLYPDRSTLGPEHCGKPTLSFVRLCTYALATFATVQEIRDAMEDETFPVVYGEKDWGILHPIHFQFVDQSGDALVLEYTKAGRAVFNNTVGVFTNSPTYDWHMENLRNYPQLENRNREGFGYEFKGEEFFIPTAGSGSGFAGLPGDYTSVSRFVKAATLLKFVVKPKDRDEALAQTFHLMNAADIPTGLITIPLDEHEYEITEKAGKKKKKGKENVLYDATSFITIKSLEEGCVYIRAYTDLSIQRMCFDEMPKDVMRSINVEGVWKRTYREIKAKDMDVFEFDSTIW